MDNVPRISEGWISERAWYRLLRRQTASHVVMRKVAERFGEQAMYDVLVETGTDVPNVATLTSRDYLKIIRACHKKLGTEPTEAEVKGSSTRGTAEAGVKGRNVLTARLDSAGPPKRSGVTSGAMTLPADRAKRAADALREMAAAFGRLHGDERAAAVAAQARVLCKVGLLNLAAVIEGAPVTVTAPTPTPRPPTPTPNPCASYQPGYKTPLYQPQGKPVGNRVQPDNRKRIAEGGGLKQLVVKLYANEHVHSARCENCHRWFLSMRAAKTCSPKCRVALHRKRKRKAA
jgi:hypothetical protein